MRPDLPHQIPAHAYVQGKPHIALFMDTRLGKIHTAFNWALDQGLQNVLTITPNSAIPDWLKEAERDGMSAIWIQGSSPEKWATAQAFYAQASIPRFYICNPEGLYHSEGNPCKKCNGSGYDPNSVFLGDQCRKCKGSGKLRATPMIGPFAQMPFDAIIMDESVKIRNPKCQLLKVLYALHDIPNRAILSGEPAPQGPEDLFSQLAWCFGSFMGCTNFYKWRHRYFGNFGFKWAPRPKAKEKINAAKNEIAFTLTRRQAGLEHVPPYYHKREVELPPPLRAEYDDVEARFEIRGQQTKHKVVVQTWLRQLAGGYPLGKTDMWSRHKVNALVALVTEELPEQPIPIIFAFNQELIAARAAFLNERLKVRIITGATPPETRKQTLRDFQAGLFPYLMMQIACASYGMDLSIADTMIRFSLPWEYNLVSQSHDRMFHPEKRRPIAFYDMVSRDTVDEDVHLAAQKNKVGARFFMNTIEENFTARQQRRAA